MANNCASFSSRGVVWASALLKHAGYSAAMVVMGRLKNFFLHYNKTVPLRFVVCVLVQLLLFQIPYFLYFYQVCYNYFYTINIFRNS